ncbi:hypothetical protein MRS44_017783 [Fusarium solani]|uniref:uncharacterized protein n=1 Tax=Fusarium solani TaxID=169388 RepID=UPI0032C4289E|nr:hypothetical protein MRS44_017783 [Fusarium solani]
MFSSLADKPSTIVFHRLLQYYDDFNTFAATLGVMSLTAMVFGVLQAEDMGVRSQIACRLLISATITSITAITSATMLQFTFEGCKQPSRMGKILAWAPLAMLDLVIIEFSAGVILWYTDKYPTWIATSVGVELSVLLGGLIILAIWAWITMSEPGGLVESGASGDGSTVRPRRMRAKRSA